MLKTTITLMPAMPETEGPAHDMSEQALQEAVDCESHAAVDLASRPLSPERHDDSTCVVPYVLEELASKSLHFSISEIQSRMRLDDPYALDLEYTRLMMGFLLFVPDPRRITMIGLGGGSLAKFCWRNIPRARIDVVEINPHVIALRDEFLVPRDDERFRVIADDGARHVRGRRDECDVLIVDGFDSHGQPARLCSNRFYDEARTMLAPGGVMVVNLHSGHRRHEIHVARIRRSFGPAVLGVDDFDGSNQIVFALKSAAFDTPAEDSSDPCSRLGTAANRQLRSAFRHIRAAQRNPRP
jgi:spermidine synthase